MSHDGALPCTTCRTSSILQRDQEPLSNVCHVFAAQRLLAQSLLFRAVGRLRTCCITSHGARALVRAACLSSPWWKAIGGGCGSAPSSSVALRGGP